MSIVVYVCLSVEFLILNSSELHTNAVVIVMSQRREKGKEGEKEPHNCDWLTPPIDFRVRLFNDKSKHFTQLIRIEIFEWIPR